MRSISIQDYLNQEKNKIESIIEIYNCKGIKQFITEPQSSFRNYQCVKCEGLLCKAVQTECGCRYCADCVKTLINDTEDKFCQGNSEDCAETKMNLDNITIDKATNREIAKFVSLKCYYKHCPTSDKLPEIIEHLETCEFREILCPNEGCDQRIQQNRTEHHVKNECSKRQVECPHCSDKMMFDYLHHTHLKLSEKSNFNDICSQLIGNCIFCDNESILIKNHVLHSCKEQPVICVFPSCMFKCFPTQLFNHLLMNNHAQTEVKSLVDKINGLEREIKNIHGGNQDELEESCIKSCIPEMASNMDRTSRQL